METSTRRVEPEEALSHVGRVLERVLTGYHRAKRHGGADRVTTSELDGLRAATTERAFRRADRLPPDAECSGSSKTHGPSCWARATTS
jgi:hypothetical protein